MPINPTLDQPNAFPRSDVHRAMPSQVRVFSDVSGYRLVFDAHPSPIMKVSSDGILSDFNPAAEPLLASWKCAHVGDRIPQAWRHLLDEAVRSGNATEVNVCGQSRIWKLTVRPIAGTNFLAIYGYDVTEYEQAQSEKQACLRSLGERVKELSALESTTRLLFQHRTNDRKLLRKVAEAVRASLQFPNAAVRIRYDQIDVQTDGFRRTPWSVVKKFTTSGGKCGSLEVVYLEQQSSAHIDPFLIEEHHVLNAISRLLRTHFERRETEAQLRYRERQLRQAQKLEAVGTLTSGIAHEFNNLLHTMKGYLELARDGLPADDPCQEDLRIVGMAVDRADGLTRQLLSFSRPQEAELTCICPNQVVSELIQLIRPLIRSGIQIVTDLDEKADKIYADTVLLQQMLLNLCLNARDAMPDGGRLTIRTRRRTLHNEHVLRLPGLRPGDYLVLSVTDTGTGMSLEVQQRIFEPFFTTKPASQGTGLGLSLVYGIVQQHGGTIEVHSRPRQGTTFHIYLPMAEHLSPKNNSDGNSSDHPLLMNREDEHIL